MSKSDHALSSKTSPIAVRAFRSAVQFQGVLLGELAHALAAGRLDAIGLGVDGAFDDVAKAGLFMIGGSLGTQDYSGRVLPQIAALRMQHLGGLSQVPQFVPTTISSFDAGARGAWFALPHSRRSKTVNQANEFRRRGRVPLLTAVDVGGTKIHIIVAEMSETGLLAEHPVIKLTIPTPRLDPSPFYLQLAKRLCAVREIAGNYELLPLIAVGQPGRFENARSKIGEGTALDLGSFAGMSPARCLERHLVQLGLTACEVLTSNDGRTQQAGMLFSWPGLNGEVACDAAWRRSPVLYFGLGTGLGSSFCRIDPERDEFGQVRLSFINTPTLGGVRVNPDWLAAQVEACALDPAVGRKIVHSTAYWRELLSAVFVRRFLAASEFASEGLTTTMN